MRAETLRQLARVRADNRDLLNVVAGTQGTALGRKNFDASGEPSGEPCIVIYVPHKINEALLDEGLAIPSVLKSADGELEALTDVVVTTTPESELPQTAIGGDNLALVRKLQWLDGQLDYLAPGAQLGGGDIAAEGIIGYSGTLGYAVKTRGNPQRKGILTNQHVGLRPGHTMYIPSFNQQSLDVGITRQVAEYIPDDGWIPGVDEKDAFVRIDAAFVAVRDKYAHLLRNEVPGAKDGRESATMGAPFEVNYESLDVIGTPVKKVGRTTGLQRGVVVAYGYGIWSEEEALQRAIGREPPNYYTDFLIAPRGESKTFSTHGDSGSAILIDRPGHPDDNRPIALLWGGWPGDIDRLSGVEDLTYGISIHRLLQHMELDLL